MSPPSQRIIAWIHNKGFANKEETENYVHQHGGASLTMDASIAFVFGATEPEIETPKATGKTPLEQIQQGEQPTAEGEAYSYTYTQPAGALPEEVRESIQAEPSPEIKKKSLFRRFIDFFS